MTARMRAGLALMGLLLGGSAVAEAQARTTYFGPRVLYNFDAESFGIGVGLTAPIQSGFSFYPSFDYYFLDLGTSFQINADVKYQFPNEDLQWLYVAAGVGISRFSYEGFSSTDAGLNLVGGFQPAGAARIKPFVEAKLGIGDGSYFQVAGGINIPLGR